MSTANSTSEYLLLFRGTDWDRSLSPAELQKTMTAFSAWFERLKSSGTILGGQPLLHDARIVSGKDGRTITDGPFAESKEAIGGYLLIRAESFEGAVAVARQCPLLSTETVVEIRPIAAECPTLQRVRQTLARELEPALA